MTLRSACDLEVVRPHPNLLHVKVLESMVPELHDYSRMVCLVEAITPACRSTSSVTSMIRRSSDVDLHNNRGLLT